MQISEVQPIANIAKAGTVNRIDRKDFIIRDAKSPDCPDIVRIWREGCMISAGIPAPPLDKALEAFSRRLRSSRDQSRLWVAEADGRTVGWQALSLGGGTQVLPMGISSTYIDADWHSKRVGGALLRHAQQEAARMGLWYLLGWIKVDNEPSIRMVRSLGWTMIGTLPQHRLSQNGYSWWAYCADRLLMERSDL